MWRNANRTEQKQLFRKTPRQTVAKTLTFDDRFIVRPSGQISSGSSAQETRNQAGLIRANKVEKYSSSFMQPCQCSSTFSFCALLSLFNSYSPAFEFCWLSFASLPSAIAAFRSKEKRRRKMNEQTYTNEKRHTRLHHIQT